MIIKTYEELRKQLSSRFKILLVKTYTCSECEIVKNNLSSFLIEYNLEFDEIYIEDVPMIASELLVLSAPTLLIFIDSKEVFRESKIISLTRLDRFINIVLDSNLM